MGKRKILAHLRQLIKAGSLAKNPIDHDAHHGYDTVFAPTDINLDRLRYLDEILPANVTGIYSDPHAVEQYSRVADLVIGSVLLPGARAPKLIPRALLSSMQPGSVIVDVCIDQGGCTDTPHHTP